MYSSTQVEALSRAGVHPWKNSRGFLKYALFKLKERETPHSLSRQEDKIRDMFIVSVSGPGGVQMRRVVPLVRAQWVLS